MIDITGFRVTIIVASDISGAHPRGKVAKFFSPSIIENEDFELAGRIVHSKCRDHGCSDHTQRFVVGRYENVDGRPVPGILRQSEGWTAQWTQGLEVAEKKRDKRIKLSQDQCQHKDRVPLSEMARTG